MKTNRIAAAMLGVFAVAWAGVATAGDWPQWLGPNHDGTIAAEKFSAKWPEDGPAIMWKKKIGFGFASMAAVGGRIYAIGNEDATETLYCFDAATGQEKWKHSYAGRLVNRLHEGGPSSTPAVAEGRVYSLGKEGQLFCLDAATGEIKWKLQLGEVLKIKTPEWGFTSSPVVEQGRVYLQAGATIALDAGTGELIWKSKQRTPAYTTPRAFDHNGKRRLAVLNSEGLVVVDAADGNELAFHAWKTDFDTNATTPIVLGDRVFISTGYNKGCALLRFTGDSLTPIYHVKSMSNHMNNAVPLGEFLYGFDGNSHQSRQVKLKCIEIATGKERWSELGLGCGSLIAVGSTLLILSDGGELVTAEATPAGFRPISRAQVLGGKCWTHPIVSDGRAFVRNARGDLVAVDVSR